MASLAGNLNKDEQQFAGEALEDEALSQKGAKRSAIENPPTDEPAVAKRRGPLKSKYLCDALARKGKTERERNIIF